jgi:hypothetical protein
MTIAVVFQPTVKSPNKKNVALATTDKIDTINVKDPLNPNVGALCDRSFGPVAR